jgi:hypothetical protein
MGEPSASPEQATWLGWLPLPALILAGDGSAVAVNPAWATVLASDGDRWLEVIEPPFRSALGARLRLAAAAGEPGSADCRVTGPRGSRWSRWWWHPVPPHSLVVCVGVTEGGQASAALPVPGHPPGPPAPGRPGAAPGINAERAMAVINRIFEAGLALESAASMLEGPLATLAQRAVDDLDQLVRQIRDAVYGSQTRPADPLPPHAEQ